MKLAVIRQRIPRGTVRLKASQVKAALGALVSPREDLVEAFEATFARHIGAKHGIAVSSGKAALALALKACGFREGDGVILQSFNVPEVPAVLMGLKLRPLFADIDLDTFTMDPQEALASADKSCRFLLVTHLYGNPADLDGLLSVGKAKDLIVIEDCAQALHARWDGRHVGTFGRLAFFSFGLMKNLNTLRGGMIVTEDPDLAQRIRGLVANGKVESRLRLARDLALAIVLAGLTDPKTFSTFVYPILRIIEEIAPEIPWRLAKMRPKEWEEGPIGVERLIMRMGPVEAAMGLEGLPVAEAETSLRVRNATLLRARLEGLEGLVMQKQRAKASPSWTQFVVRISQRALVRRALLRQGIDTTVGYLRACNRLPFVVDKRPCPKAERLEEEHLYLPCSPDLLPEEVERVAKVVRQVIEGRQTENFV